MRTLTAPTRIEVEVILPSDADGKLVQDDLGLTGNVESPAFRMVADGICRNRWPNVTREDGLETLLWMTVEAADKWEGILGRVR